MCIYLYLYMQIDVHLDDVDGINIDVIDYVDGVDGVDDINIDVIDYVDGVDGVDDVDGVFHYVDDADDGVDDDVECAVDDVVDDDDDGDDDDDDLHVHVHVCGCMFIFLCVCLCSHMFVCFRITCIAALCSRVKSWSQDLSGFKTFLAGIRTSSHVLQRGMILLSIVWQGVPIWGPVGSVFKQIRVLAM